MVVKGLKFWVHKSSLELCKTSCKVAELAQSMVLTGSEQSVPSFHSFYLIYGCYIQLTSANHFAHSADRLVSRR